MKISKFHLLLAALILTFVACKPSKQYNEQTTDYSKTDIPLFNADSAYSYVAEQCSFGPRVPMSEAHRRCGEYIIDFMKRHCDTVYEQRFNTELYDGTAVTGTNIIAVINPSATDRVLLAAHWDSRAWADNDKDTANHNKPVMGANDGASGVGILMEIARIIKTKPCNQGIDIVFFDLEDQGAPSWADYQAEDQRDWCLGSQYWSQNLHLPFYTANYGILLDMVGYSSARFTKEYQSMGYAESIMNKVWDVAASLGYGNIFLNERTAGIMDDHVWVNHYAKIPMIDIVQNDAQTNFFPHWHTTSDDLKAISKTTLQAVGKVCLTTIYSVQ
ncbi:MAG: M28 family peptidase [Bacteroidales bacterium]|jgi:Zn-dependent M28 family amino/carboxypeptidase|nr:M28 family peptidase [Bacteroidales bacterium]